MSDLPNPLTPPDCDLRGGFDWMPLWGHRMFSSSWYRVARKDGRGGIASLKLWWSAMLQHPAGSLPNDEEELCMLADFGEDMRAWRKHRAVAMHGFILCCDNRWYHPMVAEQAVEAYGRRLKAQASRQTDAERLRRWRAANGHPPTKPNGHHPPETEDETRFTEGSVHRSETGSETHDETRAETPDETSRATTVQNKTRQVPPRSPPVNGGAAQRVSRRSRPAKNAFHDLGREFDAEMAQSGRTIEGTAEEVADFQAFRRRLAGGGYG